jgi:hypothetical protein
VVIVQLDNKSSMASKTKQSEKSSVSWAQAVRDIFVASIDKGQLPVLGIIFIFVMLIWKMPEQDVSRLMFQFFESLQRYESLGYVLSLILSIGWFSHVRQIRMSFRKEAERIGQEKSNLQNKLSDSTFESSE